MQNKFLLFFFLGLVFFSCQEDNKQRAKENKKDAAKREILFLNIQKAWVFNDAPINEVSENALTNWKEFRELLAEMAQTPKKSIGAFQKKASQFSKKAELLENSIPAEFAQPQVKIRIATLQTKIQLMDMYIHLNQIQDKKVVLYITEINKELIALQRQMEKIIEKNKIPVEEGEADMIKMLDAARAIPTLPQQNQGMPTIVPPFGRTK